MGKEIILHKLSASGPGSFHTIFKKFVIGFYLFVLSLALYQGFFGRGINWSVLGMMLFGGLIGYTILEAIIPSRALQDVFDAGDFLLLRKKGKEIRLPLGEIANFSYEYKAQTPMFHFSYLNEEKQLIYSSFICPFNYYSEEPQIKKLIARIEAAQEKAKE